MDDKLGLGSWARLPNLGRLFIGELVRNMDRNRAVGPCTSHYDGTESSTKFKPRRYLTDARLLRCIEVTE
jgi:hypothetical protein